METAPPLLFHVEFIRTGDSEEDPVPGLQLFAFDEALSILDSSDFRNTEGEFLGHSVSWNLRGPESYTARIDTQRIPSNCTMILLVTRVSSALCVKDLASSMGYTLEVVGDSSVQVCGLDLTFDSGETDWFVAGALVFDRRIPSRILFKDISSFPDSRGNVINQIRDLARTLGREVPPPEITLPNWYVLWDELRPISPPTDTSTDRTAFLVSHKIPYLDEPIVSGDPTTSPRNMVPIHRPHSAINESVPVVTFAPPSPTREHVTSPCAHCLSMKNRIVQLESALYHMNENTNGPDSLVEENKLLKDKVAELEVQLKAADILITKLKQVRTSTEQFGFDFTPTDVNIPDFSHMKVPERFTANLKLQEDLLVSLKEQVMRINSQVHLGRRLRGIPLPGDTNAIHMS